MPCYKNIGTYFYLWRNEIRLFMFIDCGQTIGMLNIR